MESAPKKEISVNIAQFALEQDRYTFIRSRKATLAL